MSTQQDFIDLNVPGLMERYSNPSDTWQESVRALATTQLQLFQKHGLINESASALAGPVEKAVVRFSDYTALGQQFIMSKELDKWLRSCDRRRDVSAYKNLAPLERRIIKFIQAQQAVPADRPKTGSG